MKTISQVKASPMPHWSSTRSSRFMPREQNLFPDPGNTMLPLVQCGTIWTYSTSATQQSHFLSIMATTKSLQWSNFFFTLAQSVLESQQSYYYIRTGVVNIFKVKPLNRQLHLYFCWILYLKVYVEKLNSLAFTVSLFLYSKCPFFNICFCDWTLWSAWSYPNAGKVLD